MLREPTSQSDHWQGVSRGSVALLLWLFLLLAVANPAQGDTPVGLVINEINVSNNTFFDNTSKEYPDWIELYNIGPVSVNAQDYYLSDDPTNLKMWRLPNVTIGVGGRLLIFAGGMNTATNANFKLKHDGEIISLYNDVTKVVVDHLDYTPLPQIPNISYGRVTDGASQWGYFANPTPNTSNNAQTPVLDVTRELPLVEFSLGCGYYDASQEVSLSVPGYPTAEIRYTTNGNYPSATAALYTGPITVMANTTIKARAYLPTYLPSRVSFETYFVGERQSNLAVFAISIDHDDMFSSGRGIYHSNNYTKEWERPITITMLETDGRCVITQEAGIRISGNQSRNLPQKSLQIVSGWQYGDNRFHYPPLFPDKELRKITSFVLRNSGGDFRYTMMGDAMMQALVKDQMDLDYQAYRPAVAYINGQYWGIMNIREKAVPAYLDMNYGVKEENLNMLKDGYTRVVGDRNHFNALVNYVSTQDMTTASAYAHVQTQLDVDAFINYMLTEIFVGNNDWVTNNAKFWRETPNGRWRYILFDLDRGFRMSTAAGGGVAHNTLWYVLTPDTTFDGQPLPAPGYEQRWMRPLFRGLMQNEQFRNDYVQRMNSHINISVHPDRVAQVVYDMSEVIRPEMPFHIARWNYSSDAIANMTVWQNNLDGFNTFAQQRPAHVRSHMETHLGVSGVFDLTVHINDHTQGNVTIHEIPMLTPSMTGPYYQNIPVRLKAMEYAGYQFLYWDTPDGQLTSEQITLTRTSAYEVTAVFAPLPPILINEIHYNPASFQEADGREREYLELHLPATYHQPISLTGYHFSKGLTYTFTTGTQIAPGEYIVLAKDATVFAGAPFQVFQFEAGSLSNSGEKLELLDHKGRLINMVSYSDLAPWPSEADGHGPSLALSPAATDNTLASSWQASLLLGGTPGLPNDYLPPEGPIRINEIHYNPSPAQGSNDHYEFLELVNLTSEPVDLSGWRFSAGISHTFANGTVIPAGGYLVLAKHAPSYANLGYPVIQWQNGSLSNSGEWLWLVDADGQTVDEVWYQTDGDWTSSAHATGFSFELKPNAPHNLTADQWEPSIALGGTPGRANDRDVPTLFMAETTAVLEDGGWVALPLQMEFPLWQPVYLGVQTADGTAVAGQDYPATSYTLTIPIRGQASTLTLPLLADTLYEADETFTIHLTPHGMSLPHTVITVTILNDDAPPAFSGVGVMVTEGETAEVVLQLDTESGLPASLSYATADDSALAEQDYTPISGTIAIPAGQTAVTLTMPTLDNGLNQPERGFLLHLSDPAHATIATSPLAITIMDDDPEPSLTVADVTVNEGETAVVTLTLSAPSGYEGRVDVATADGSAIAPDDYQPIATSVVFPAGTLTQTVTIVTLLDGLNESPETFTLELSNPQHATLAASQAIVTIADNDDEPELSTADVTVNEGETAEILLTLNLASGQTITVDVYTFDGTAMAGDDYLPVLATITFPAGTITQTVSITTLLDGLSEADETFTVVLTNVVNAVLVTEQITVTMLDNDAQPHLSVGDVTVSEGDGTADFIVSLDLASGQDIWVDVATADGSALAGLDYHPLTATLHFPAGTLTQTVSVVIVDDGLLELDETFTLVLSNPVHAELGQAVGTAVIVDNDGSPEVNTADITLPEGHETHTILVTVTLSVSHTAPVTVAYTTADGTALAGVDYEATSGLLVFAPGQTVQTIAIVVLGNTTAEADKLFTLVLSDPLHTTLGKATAVITLLNDDQDPPQPNPTIYLPLIQR